MHGEGKRIGLEMNDACLPAESKWHAWSQTEKSATWVLVARKGAWGLAVRKGAFQLEKQQGESVPVCAHQPHQMIRSPSIAPLPPRGRMTWLQAMLPGQTVMFLAPLPRCRPAAAACLDPAFRTQPRQCPEPPPCCRWSRRCIEAVDDSVYQGEGLRLHQIDPTAARLPMTVPCLWMSHLQATGPPRQACAGNLR